MIEIYIIRHGETAKNKERVLQGRSDLPLNEAGISQSEDVGNALAEVGIDFDRVYSSPLQRAVQTAEIVTGSDDIVTDDHLLEMDYGPYEGCSLLDPPPEIITFFSDFINNPAPEGMEPLDQVIARMGEFMEKLAADLADNRTEDPADCRANRKILISTHAIAMKGALEYLTPESNGAYWNKHVANCAVYKTTLTDDGFTVPVEVKI